MAKAFTFYSELASDFLDAWVVGVEADSNFTDAWAVGSDAWAVSADAWAVSADAWAGGVAFDVILLYSKDFYENSLHYYTVSRSPLIYCTLLVKIQNLLHDYYTITTRFRRFRAFLRGISCLQRSV